MKDFEYEIDWKPNPKFEISPAKRVPYAIKDEVKAELDAMVKMGVIKHVNEPTPAVSQMVIVRIGGKIRICLDPVDVNKNILRRHHPLQTVEEVAAKIKNSKFFTLLDCKRGFWQVKIASKSQKYLTFSTPWGRYCCLRLPFGLSSAPEIFQKIIFGWN